MHKPETKDLPGQLASQHLYEGASQCLSLAWTPSLGSDLTQLSALGRQRGGQASLRTDFCSQTWEAQGLPGQEQDHSQLLACGLHLLVFTLPTAACPELSGAEILQKSVLVLGMNFRVQVPPPLPLLPPSPPLLPPPPPPFLRGYPPPLPLLLRGYS